MYAPCIIQGPSKKHTQLEFWGKGLFTEDWSGLINAQEIAKHAGLATLGSCYHPCSWRGKGQSWSGDTSQELLCERTHLPPDWGTGWAQPETGEQKALGDVSTKVSPQRNTEQHSKGKKKTSGVKRGWKDKRKIKHNNYRTLQRTEILNKETNHSPLILHLKEIYSLKECPVFLDISIKADICNNNGEHLSSHVPGTGSRLYKHCFF